MVTPDATAMALNDLYDRVAALEGTVVQLVQVMAQAGLLRVVVASQGAAAPTPAYPGESPLPGL